MSELKKAAIDMDTLGKTPLTEISVADFLVALDKSDVSIQRLVGLPEKKKVELWVEPENPPTGSVGDLIGWIRSEKKKLELELPPDFEDWKKIRETRYNDLVGRVAKDVEARLREPKG